MRKLGFRVCKSEGNLTKRVCLDGSRMQSDKKYRIPDTGYRIPDTGYRIPDTGYRIPRVGRTSVSIKLVVNGGTHHQDTRHTKETAFILSEQRRHNSYLTFDI